MKLTFQSGVFVWEGGYETKDLPKAAGFRWDPDKRRWWSNRPDCAVRLKDHADAAAREAMGYAEQNLEASRAANADIEIPCPSGLEYMPFQKAGILYCLRVFGDL